jgi:hypothetical protein
MSEHSKSLNTFGGLLGYYKERENTVNYDDPLLRKQIAISVRMEKEQRVAKI